MSKAKEIFKEYWERKTGKPADETTLIHMSYCIDAIDSALISRQSEIDELNKSVKYYQDESDHWEKQAIEGWDKAKELEAELSTYRSLLDDGAKENIELKAEVERLKESLFVERKLNFEYRVKMDRCNDFISLCLNSYKLINDKTSHETALRIIANRADEINQQNK